MKIIKCQFNEKTRIVSATIKAEVDCYKMGDSPNVRETFGDRPSCGNYIGSKSVRMFFELFYDEATGSYGYVATEAFTGKKYNLTGNYINYWNGQTYTGREDFEWEDIESLIDNELDLWD